MNNTRPRFGPLPGDTGLVQRSKWPGRPTLRARSRRRVHMRGGAVACSLSVHRRPRWCTVGGRSTGVEWPTRWEGVVVGFSLKWCDIGEAVDPGFGGGVPYSCGGFGGPHHQWWSPASRCEGERDEE
jgi:hypothetical protein